MENNQKYFAFISYKREDEEWAKWLQHKLEHYRLPSNLNGRSDLPKEIRPIFRDKSDLAGGVLADEINNALENSKYLIVICSPRAAQSNWVNKEVQTFIDLGRTDKIIPFIIGGVAHAKNSEEECFPLTLRTLPSEKELLGVNINEMGRDAAAVKVIAQMFGLQFDELWQRHEREKRKKHAIVIIGSILLAMLGMWIGVYFHNLNQKMKITQSRYLAKESLNLINDAEYDKANMLLLNILATNTYSTDVEYTIRNVYDKPIQVSKLTKHKNSVANRRLYNGIIAIDYTPDGKYLLTASNADNKICIWNTETWDIIDSLMYIRSIYSAKYINDGKQIIATGREIDGTNKLLIWDFSSRQGVYEEKYYNFKPVDGNGCYFITKESIYIVLRDTLGKWVSSLYDCNIFNIVNDVAINYVGDRAVISHNNGEICLWDTKTTQYCDTLSLDNRYKSMRFSKKGELIVSRPIDSTVLIWDVHTDTCIKSIKVNSKFSRAELSADESVLVTTSNDSIFRVWDVKTSKLLNSSKQNENISYIKLSPNNKQIACGLSDGSIRIYDISNNVFLNGFYLPNKINNHALIFGFVNNSRHIAVRCLNNVEFIDIYTGLSIPENCIYLDDTTRNLSYDQINEIIKPRFPDFKIISNIPYGNRLHVFQGKNDTLNGIYAGNNLFVSTTNDDISLYSINTTTGKIKKKGTIYIKYPYDNSLFYRDYKSEGITINNRYRAISLSKHYLLLVIKNKLYICDIKSGRIIHDIQTESLINNAVLSPDEKIIVIVDDQGYVGVYDFPSIQTITDRIKTVTRYKPMTREERYQYYLE